MLRRLADHLRAIRSGARKVLNRRSADEAKASATNALLRAAMDELQEGLVLLDPDGRYLHWNKSYAEIYKRSADLFRVGAKIGDTLRIGIARGDYPEAMGREEEWLAERMRHLQRAGERHEQQLSDGRWIMIDERRMDDGCTIGIRVDVTEMKRREASFRLLFDSNPVPMFVYERQTLSILAANEAACELYGYDQRSFLSMSYGDICIERSQPMRTDAGVASSDQHKRADGALLEVTSYARSFTYEGRSAIIVSALDMTERNRSEAQIAFLARHDPLTGLANRTLFRERLEFLCEDLTSRYTSFSLLLIDLDGFKGVNDTLGHGAGDLLLQAASERITNAAADADIVARLGGDEFAILHPKAHDKAAILAFARDIIESLRRPFLIDGQEVMIGSSIGIACAPVDGQSPDVLMRRADLALYASKNAGKGEASLFVPELDAALLDRRRLEADLRIALTESQLDVFYQPIIDIASGRITCMEALVRWVHPERGVVYPQQFIPIAEETGLICEVGEYVLRRACYDAACWPDDVRVAVNLSPVQFRRSNLLLNIMMCLKAAHLAPQRLDLEITEALVMDKSEATLATLRALRNLGVGLSMDDFGTGFSSLSYLRTFPFSKIKIDRSFVKDISNDPDSQAIVRAIIGLGKTFNLRVTAEGVESEADLAFLASVGCDEGQGYAIGKPAPIDRVSLFIDEKAHEAAA